ncbi:MAG: hypothetical protein KAI47_00685 [Deltaproteobacteria bacterium]|nr:hypothetical protein [Deltaproteobacteria bacterium]
MQRPTWLTAQRLRPSWGSASNNIWAVGHLTLIHWDGTSWTPQPNVTESLEAVWGTDATHVWTVDAGGPHLGTGVVRRWNGTKWTQVHTTSRPLVAISGSSNDDIWALQGDAFIDGSVSHWDGATWSETKLSVRGELKGIWAAHPDDVWIVGRPQMMGQGEATVLHWDGSTWSSVSSGTTNGLYGIWGTGRSDVWTAGGGATVLHLTCLP